MSPACDTRTLRTLQSTHHHTVFPLDSGYGTDLALVKARECSAYLTGNS